MVVFYILLNKVHFAKCILLFVERVNHPFLCHPTDYGSKSKVNSMDVVPHICAKVCCLCPIKKRNGQIPFFIFEAELQNDKCGKTYYDEGQKRRHYICSNDILWKCFALCVRKYFSFRCFISSFCCCIVHLLSLSALSCASIFSCIAFPVAPY